MHDYQGICEIWVKGGSGASSLLDVSAGQRTGGGAGEQRTSLKGEIGFGFEGQETRCLWSITLVSASVSCKP